MLTQAAMVLRKQALHPHGVPATVQQGGIGSLATVLSDKTASLVTVVVMVTMSLHYHGYWKMIWLSCCAVFSMLQHGWGAARAGRGRGGGG